MKYIKSEKYNTPALMKKIMGPNPVKLEEELLINHKIPQNAIVCDLGSGQGLTSVFLAKEYGFTVYAADLWSDPDENQKFFDDSPGKKEYSLREFVSQCLRNYKKSHSRVELYRCTHPCTWSEFPDKEFQKIEENKKC